MRFLVDMNLSVDIAAALRQEGPDAVHLRELGLQRLDDRAILAKALEEARIVLTFDLDFGDLATAGVAPVGVPPSIGPHFGPSGKAPGGPALDHATSSRGPW